MKYTLTLLWFIASSAFAQTLPSPAYNNVTVNGTATIPHAAITGGTITGLSAPIPLGSGGTNCAAASGTCLDNIAGFGSTGFMSRTGSGAYSFTTSTGAGSVVLATSPTLVTPTLGAATATSLTANGAPVNGPLNVKMSASGQSTTGYTENFSTTDDQGSSPWNTPNYFTLRDVYKGTRGTNHGNASFAGDGNGGVLDFQSWSRRGIYLDAVTINGGLESAAANAECSDLDINGYVGGNIVAMAAFDMCGGGLTSTPTLFPYGDIAMNLGWSTRRWNNGYFGGTVNMATAAISGNAFISGSALITGQGGMPLYGTTGTGVNGPHMVTGTATLSGGSATVTLSGSAVYTSSSSYACTANDTTAAAAVKVSQSSGTSITLTGTGTDVVQFMCAGS